MKRATLSYPCGMELRCENKTTKGPRDVAHCNFCSAFFLTAVRGDFKRHLVYQPDDPLLYVFGLVDALGAKKPDNHLVYFLFRALHNAARATYGKRFAKLHALMMDGIERAPSFSWDTDETDRPCRKCCGRDAPGENCASSCAIAVSYLNDIYREGGADSLELARRILDAFMEMPGYGRKKATTVCDEILGTDPMSCAEAGQYNRKVCHGIEISLMDRFEAWRIKQEKLTGCCEPSEEVPF